MNDLLIDSSMELITHAGEARTKYMQALEAARRRCFDEVDSLLEEAGEEYRAARLSHMSILSHCAKENIDPDILLVHAQEHLTLAEAAKNLADEIIALRRELFQGQ